MTSGSHAQLGLYVGEDWYTQLCTYDDHPPILTITTGSVTTAITVADRKVTASAVEFARELASHASEFAAEIGRHHARLGDTDAGTCAAGAGEAA